MTWLFEQPLAIVIIGVVLLLGLGTAWSMTGRKELLYALGATLALIVVGLIVERLVITDREAIQATLLTIARDVQSNNRRAILGHVHSSATELKQRAETELANYQFTECRVTRIHLVDVNARAQPRSAVVEFNVIASGTFRQGTLEVSDTSVPRWVRLNMLRENDGRWTVESYEHAPPQQFMFNRPQQP
jgi:hypothetical protein